LIEPADVLFVNACDSVGETDADLIVAGIPDEQLVVFTGAPVRPGQPSGGDVPAVSPLGVVLLSVLVLGAGGAIKGLLLSCSWRDRVTTGRYGTDSDLNERISDARP